MTTLAEQAAARGAAFLDQKHPGWWDRINVGSLSIASTCQCVVGQLYAGRATDYGYDMDDDAYVMGLLDLFGEDIADEMAVYHGFDAWGRLDDHYGYGELTDAWRAEITRRRIANRAHMVLAAV